MTSFVSDTFSVSVASQSALAAAATALSAGESAAFPEGEESTFTTADFAWQSASYHDEIHGLVHIMGKPANNNPAWKHQYYDIVAETWTVVGTSLWDSPGHIYDNLGMDSETGDLYLMVGNQKRIKKWDYQAFAWTELPTDIYSGSLNSTQNGLCIHPTLYGVGNKGIVEDDPGGLNFYDLANDSVEDVPHSPERLGANAACAQYLPGIEKVILGNKDGEQALIGGNGGATPTVEFVGAPPIRAVADGLTAGRSFGTMHLHPSDSTRMLLLERTLNGARRVWQTTDGDNWTLKGYSHPFPHDNGTIVTLSQWGTLWFIGYDGSGARTTVLWKPDD